MSYNEQLTTVRKLKVHDGESSRFNCPFCNGWNTLGVSKINGVLEWHCFKSSCVAHGISEDGMSIAGMREKLTSKEYNKLDAPVSGKPIPEFLTVVRSNEEVLDYLKSVNSYLSYENKLVDIKFSPSENRVMFPIRDSRTKNGPIIGYSGRRLGHYGAKWVKYGDLSSFFACGVGPVGVLVEDAPSACAVGIIPDYTGISLLGTNLTDNYKRRIIDNFNEVIICLDPDANMKALDISRKLSGTIKTNVIFIPDDLKYYTPEKIKELLNGKD